MADMPVSVAWTEHALVKAEVLGISHADVATWVTEGHRSRARNAGSGDWRVAVGRIVVVYNHPDAGDDLTARVVTVWRRR